MDFPEKSLEVVHIDEPELEFNYYQKTDHPKDGLFLYGPRRGANFKEEITIGVVGTKSGISYFKDWAKKAMKTINVPDRTEREKENRLHLSNFPGLKEAFGIAIKPDAFIEYSIELSSIETSTSIANQHEAVSRTVDVFINKIEYHFKNEEQEIDVWIFVLPEIVFERCKRQARRTGVVLSPGEYAKKQSARSDLPLLAPVIDTSKEDVFDDIPDFHRQMKSRLLAYNAPSQLIRETTLAPEKFLNSAGYPKRGTQEPATVAWNLSTGLFYKTQSEPPWKIANMRPGVCYIGLVFKVLPNHRRNYACCAAQMFLSEGDSMIFRGANGPWQTSDWEYHLHKEAAKSLIRQVLETYQQKFGSYPKELFIHGRTKFNRDEWEAFEEVAPDETNIVGVRIGSAHGEMKLFRDGDYPCLRGTSIILDDRNAYLWTSGYLPRLDTYIGPETPNPLFITVLNATQNFPNVKSVLKDIMGLTKINYNACNYSDGLPVTIRFADKVGDVLTMGSSQGNGRQPFKFYI